MSKPGMISYPDYPTGFPIKAHTKPFPFEVWQALKAFAPSLEGKTPPLWTEHHRGLRLRRDLFEISKQCGTFVKRASQEQTPRLTYWINRQNLVLSGIAWIESWGLA